MSELDHAIGNLRSGIAMGLAAALGLTAVTGHSEPPPPDTGALSALVASADPQGTVFHAAPPRFVVHVQSGAICPMGAERFRLTRLTIAADRPRGDGITCDYEVPGGSAQVRVTRLGASGADKEIAAAMQGWRAANPGPGVSLAPMWGSYPNLKNPVVASLIMGAGPQARVASIWTADQSGWLVVVTAAYPLAARHDTEIITLTESISVRDAIRKASQGSGGGDLLHPQ